MYLLFSSDILKLLLKTNVGRNRRPNFCYFCSLEYFNCWQGVRGVEQKVLFRTVTARMK